MSHFQSDRQTIIAQSILSVPETLNSALPAGTLTMRPSNEDRRECRPDLLRSGRTTRAGIALASAIFLFAGARQLSAAPSSSDFQVPVELRPQFATAPTDEELMRVRLFSEPLAPMPGELAAGENEALGRAVETFAARTRQGDISALASFVSSFPKSRWSAAIFLNMGILQYKNGEFSQVLNDFDRAWDLSKSATTSPATFIRDRAAAEGGRMNARLGNRAWLDQFLLDANKLNISGSAGEVLRHTREAVSMMHSAPEKSFMCGPFALMNILPADVPAEIREEIRKPKSTAQGTSLALILGLSKKTGKDYQAAFRSPGAKLVVPAVVHWSVGHFAALVAERDGGVICQDPTFGEDILISSPTVDQEASGYFLVPAGPLPEGWRAVDSAEAATIWGKGIISGKREDECRPCSTKVKACCGSPGMATYNVHAMLVSLVISDTPVGYSPPYGPQIDFTATYNQRDVAQGTGNKMYSNLGPQWTHDWLSYVQADAGSAKVVESGGGYVTFSGFNSSTGHYALNTRTNSKLKLVSAGQYERTFPDGSRCVYGKGDGTGRYFLTQRVDASGHAAVVAYDANLRISTISDASGQATTFGYASAGDYKIKTVTDPFGRVATFDYDGTGRLVKITDVVGITSQFSYDSGSSFINSLETPYGKTKFSYGESGEDRWLEACDPAGDIERTEYNVTNSAIGYGSSDPIGSIPQGCDTSCLTYRNTFFWSKKAYAEGKGDYTKAHIFHWLHSTGVSGVLESEKTPFENRICYLYQDQSNPIYESDTMFSARPARILQKIDAGSGPSSTQETSFVFDTYGQVARSFDPANRVTMYSYAANNIDLLSVSRSIFNFRIDSIRSAEAVPGEWQQLAAFTYNSQHKPLTATDASGQTTTMTYNGNGQLLTVTDPLGKVTTFSYDSGRLSSVVGPLSGNPMVSLTYDPAVTTRVKTVTDIDGNTKTYDFDNLDRVTKVTYSDGTHEAITYKYLDPEWLRDRMGRWSRVSYNALRQKIAVMDAAQCLTQYSWCKCGDLKSIVDGNGHRTTWRHDVAGRIWEKEYSDGSKEEYSYDLIGRLSSVVDAASKTRSYSYAVDNSLLSTGGTTFTYNATYSRMETMSDLSGTTTFTYNPIGTLGAGRLASVSGTHANSEITYGYDALGRVTKRSINGVDRNFTFADGIRLTRETNPLGQFDYTYDGATSRIASATAATGLVSAYTYIPSPHERLLKSITHTGPSDAAISSFGYAYDGVGNIADWTQNQVSATVLPVQTWKLTMDAVDQLTGVSVAGQPALSEFFGYDNGGNRLTRQKGNSTTSATYNDLNQLGMISGGGKLHIAGTTDEPANVTVQGVPARMVTSTSFAANPTVGVGANVIPIVATDGSGNSRTNSYSFNVPPTPARSFHYDLNGNLVSDGIRTYESDALNRLVKVTLGTDVYEFSYDGFNRRVSETKNGSLTKKFVWDGLTLAEERDASNAVTKRFLPQGEMQGTTKLYHTRDHLGSIREVVDASGTVVASYSYDAWGKRTLVAGTDLASFGYTGHYNHAALNLVFAPFRAYDPETGRWLSRDPIGENGGINLYGYVGNNPINLWDPLGLESWYNDNGGGHSTLIVTDPGSRTGYSEYSYIPSQGGYEDPAATWNVPGEMKKFSPHGPPPGALPLNTTEEQDACARSAGDKMMEDPGTYNPLFNNCSDAIKSILKDAGILPRDTPALMLSPSGLAPTIDTPSTLREQLISR